MSKWTENKFTLKPSFMIDVVAILGDRIKVKTMTIAEGQAMARKPSKWRIELFQQGYHSYRPTE